MADKSTIARHQASDRALYRRSDAALYRARIHFRDQRETRRQMVQRYLKPHCRDQTLLRSLISSVTRVLVVALLILQTWTAKAQAQPTFSSSSPANATHAATLSGNLTATFSQAMSTNSVTSSTFVVHGGFIGKHSTGGTASTHKDGTYTGGGTTTLTFNPGANFKAGELVQVSLTTGLQNTSIQALTAARVYQFRAAAGTGPAVFSNTSYNVDTQTNSTRLVVLGDLDGDGDLDLVTGNDAQVNRVFLGNGNGTFASGNDVDTPTNATYNGSLGDLDGDGDLDLVTANNSAVNRVYLGAGNGTFATGNDVDTPTNDTWVALLGDLDGDGDLDLVTGNQGQVNRVYLGNGNGTFASGNDVDTPTNNTRGMDLGDLDGDGDLDLVTANFNQANRIYLGNGNGTFATGNNVDTPANNSYAVPLGDLDGDGDLDLITGNYNEANRVHLGNGNGTFATGNDLDTPTNNTLRGLLGDLDGDGDLDLITGNNNEVNRIYLSNGNGTFATGTDAATPTNATWSMSLGDVDGDGDLDFVTGNDGQVNRVYLNNNTVFSSSSPVANANNAATTSNVSATFNTAMNAATTSNFIVQGGMTGKRAGAYSGTSSTTLTFDPTSDFKPNELVEVALTTGLQNTSNFALQPAQVYRFRGAAGSATAVFSIASSNIGPVNDQTQSLALADVDGDGDLDVAIGNVASQQNVVYLNDGSGDFSDGSRNFGSTDLTQSVAFGDVDGDGDSDVAAGNTGQQNVVYLNDSAGNFTAGTKNFGSGSDSPYMMAFGDADGDGDLDIAAANLNQQNKVYLNDGAGNFTSDVNYGNGSDASRGVALGDLDGDGDLDIAGGNEGTQNKVYLNNGNVGFSSSVNFGVAALFTRPIALGDLDNDGDLDIVEGTNTGQNKVHLNDGSAGFGSSVNYGTGNDVTTRLDVGDVDGDGDLDIAAVNTSSGSGPQNKIYLNNGSASFASSVNFGTGSDISWGVALGDVDGDSDLDVVVGNLAEQNVVYYNSGNKDGTLTASGTLDESSAIALPSTATTSGAAVDLFDFTLTDGGGGDALALGVSQVVVNTSGTGPFANVTWLLNGPDASNVSGTYSSGTNKITFSSLSISVADGANETYTVRGYYNTSTGLTDGATFSFSLDGDTDLTMVGSGSSISGSNAAVSNAAAAVVGITATQLGFTTQPSPLNPTSGTQLDFTTDPVVVAQDASSNTDTDFASTVTLAQNGAGSASFANNSVAAVSGVATFSGLLLTYTATADQQTLGLTASASGVTSATSNSLTADIVATQLAFTTQPSPLDLTSGTQLDFTTDPVITARDANSNTDTDFVNTVALAENGAGTSSFSNNTATPSNGVATFSGLLFTYNATDATSIALTASASGVTSATSSSFAVTAFPLVARNKGARTSEGGSVLLSTDLLQFTDAASTTAQIVYTLGTAPTAGQLNKSGTALNAGETFTQDDIDNSRISYVHAGDEVFGDGFSFTVKGSAGLSTSSFSFGLAINADNDNPFTDVNQVLFLQEGEAVTITNGSLRVLDAEALPQEIAYTLVNLPAHGRLSLGAFTQHDIDEGRLTYRHDGGESTRDEFSFTVDDGSGAGLGTQTLKMQIAPINDAPVVPVLEAPHVAEGQLLMLVLGARDPEGAPVQMTVSGLPQGAALDGTTLKWLPTYAQAGIYPLAVAYDDGQNGTSRLRFDIEVADTSIPLLQPDPALIDFGDLAAGQSTAATFALHNPTPFALQVESFSSNTGVFAVVQPTLPLELAPDARAEFSVRFTATAGETGTQQAVLIGTTSLGTVQVPVTGRSLWSDLKTAVEIVDFGARTIGFTPWRNLRVANPGNVPLTVRAQVPDDGPFQVEPTAFTLGGGLQRDLRIHYAPQIARTFEQRLLLAAKTAHREVVLRGRGLAPEEGRVTIDFNLAAGNQQQRMIGDARPSEILDLQLHVQRVRQIAGWSARIAYDPRSLSYVANSFVPGAFLVDLIQLEQLGEGYVEIGGDVLNLADPASGNGILGTLSFRVEPGFVDAAELAVTRLTWHRAGSGGPARDIVYAPATITDDPVVLVEPGDFDGNGQIDMDDFFFFSDQFERRVPPAEPRFDLDDDGRVHYSDFFRFADLFAEYNR